MRRGTVWWFLTLAAITAGVSILATRPCAGAPRVSSVAVEAAVPGIPIKITLREERPADISIRVWRDSMRQAHEEMGALWHSKMLPRHFTRGAASRYGYQPRTRKWQQKKAALYARGKAVKRNTDLVFTGFLQETLTNFGSVRAFPTRVTIQMTGPRYITFRPHASNQPDKHSEVTRVTDDEARELSEKLNETATKLFNEYRAAKTS
ncbi:MAG: hypothetical protein KY476_00730 [Planctomycetes bacterium]|nr:hypothetical protein [Planctomycetota bacterium]